MFDALNAAEQDTYANIEDDFVLLAQENAEAILVPIPQDTQNQKSVKFGLD